jgi:hypothetical protein
MCVLFNLHSRTLIRKKEHTKHLCHLMNSTLDLPVDSYPVYERKQWLSWQKRRIVTAARCDEWYKQKTVEDWLQCINPLPPNNPYRGRTTPLTSKCCILYIYSSNIGTEYFKHSIYSPSYSLQNAICFIILTYLVPVLFTFYIKVC